jgi:hypothetical protein
MTLLWYTAVQNWWDGNWGIVQIVGVVLALAIDLSPSGARRRRRRAEPVHEDLGRELN